MPRRPVLVPSHYIYNFTEITPVDTPEGERVGMMKTRVVMPEEPVVGMNRKALCNKH